jgi:hypothetical protein
MAQDGKTQFYADHKFCSDKTIEDLGELVSLSKALCGEDMTDFFISELPGSPKLASYWVFYPAFVVEIPGPNLKENAMIFRPRPQMIKNVRVKASKFALGHAGGEAKLEMVITAELGDVMEFRASGQNCIYLKEIMKNYFPKLQ